MKYLVATVCLLSITAAWAQYPQGHMMNNLMGNMMGNGMGLWMGNGMGGGMGNGHRGGMGNGMGGGMGGNAQVRYKVYFPDMPFSA